MRFVLPTLFIFTFVLTQANAGPKVSIKIATIAPSGTTWVNELEKTNTALKNETRGGVSFRIYAGGVLGDETDVVRKMRVGQVHGAAFTGRGLGELLPDVRVLELPFLIQNDAEADSLMKGLYTEFQKKFSEKGFVLLGFVPVGFVYLFSGHPVETVETLRRQKVWIWDGDPLAQELFQSAGVSGIPLNLPDVLTSLQTGMINTVYSTPLGLIALQWQTKLKWRTDLAITHAMGGIVVTEKRFNKISVAHRKLLREMMEDLSMRLTAASRNENAEALRVLNEGGIQTTTVSDGAQSVFLALAPKVASDVTGKLFPKALLEKAQSLVEATRKATER